MLFRNGVLIIVLRRPCLAVSRTVVNNRSMVAALIESRGRKTAADAARLFKIHPATVSRLLARSPRSKAAYAK